LERHRHYFGADEISVLVREGLEELCGFQHPELTVNDAAAWSSETTVLVNGRWLPVGPPPEDLQTPRLALAGDQVAYAILRPGDLANGLEEMLNGALGSWGEALPRTEAGGWMIDHPWDLVEHNSDMLQHDYRMRSSKQDGTLRSPGLAIIGPPER